MGGCNSKQQLKSNVKIIYEIDDIESQEERERNLRYFYRNCRKTPHVQWEEFDHVAHFGVFRSKKSVIVSTEANSESDESKKHQHVPKRH